MALQDGAAVGLEQGTREVGRCWDAEGWTWRA